MRHHVVGTKACTRLNASRCGKATGRKLHLRQPSEACLLTLNPKTSTYPHSINKANFHQISTPLFANKRTNNADVLVCSLHGFCSFVRDEPNEPNEQCSYVRSLTSLTTSAIRCWSSSEPLGIQPGQSKLIVVQELSLVYGALVYAIQV